MSTKTRIGKDAVDKCRFFVLILLNLLFPIYLRL